MCLRRLSTHVPRCREQRLHKSNRGTLERDQHTQKLRPDSSKLLRSSSGWRSSSRAFTSMGICAQVSGLLRTAPGRRTSYHTNRCEELGHLQRGHIVWQPRRAFRQDDGRDLSSQRLARGKHTCRKAACQRGPWLTFTSKRQLTKRKRNGHRIQGNATCCGGIFWSVSWAAFWMRIDNCVATGCGQAARFFRTIGAIGHGIRQGLYAHKQA
mmetsp:Transcript_45437/g.145824  ORF Transcript_45437/g.145824 Transcript_45437/m.145824 type:complete len:211 (-) Transcript_45437:323-955(-)